MASRHCGTGAVSRSGARADGPPRLGQAGMEETGITGTRELPAHPGPLPGKPHGSRLSHVDHWQDSA